MSQGTLSIVGVGPGDPELLTLKAVRMLESANIVYVPVSHLSRETWMRDAVDCYASSGARICEVSFSASHDVAQRTRHWQQTASSICLQLQQGQRIVFVTLGDPQLYSTTYYLVQALRDSCPALPLEIIPGISSVSHAAALSQFTLGRGTKPLTILPSITALDDVRNAIGNAGTIVLMKIGRLLPQIIDLLEETELISHAVFIARAGLAGERIETNLRKLKGESPECGNLAVILIHTEGFS
jgi:precorrin-2/cobalt-factor-2 C20-methyltransferase